MMMSRRDIQAQVDELLNLLSEIATNTQNSAQGIRDLVELAQEQAQQDALRGAR